MLYNNEELSLQTLKMSFLILKSTILKYRNINLVTGLDMGPITRTVITYLWKDYKY